MAKTATVVKANEDVIGKTMKNESDEDLGTVKEIVLDKLTGQTAYVVLESGSFIGLGGKFFAIPWKAFHYDKGEESFILNVDKEKLKNAPGFDKNHWPEFKNSDFLSSVNNYWH